MTGEHVRMMGVGSFTDSYPYGITIHGDTIAVSRDSGTSPRVVLFSYATGAVVREFGPVGTAEGQLNGNGRALCFTPDGAQLLITEYGPHRVSVFTVAGAFVRRIGTTELGQNNYPGAAISGDAAIVSDCSKYRVCVFSVTSGGVLRAVGSQGTADGQFSYPAGVAVRGPRLYVLDYNSPRVQVFE